MADLFHFDGNSLFSEADYLADPFFVQPSDIHLSPPEVLAEGVIPPAPLPQVTPTSPGPGAIVSAPSSSGALLSAEDVRHLAQLPPVFQGALAATFNFTSNMGRAICEGIVANREEILETQRAVSRIETQQREMQEHQQRQLALMNDPLRQSLLLNPFAQSIIYYTVRAEEVS